MTEFVNANSPVEFSLWGAMFGLPLGTVSFNARVDSRAEFSDATTALLGNASYHELVERGQPFVAASGEDHLRQVVHVELPTTGFPRWVRCPPW